MHHRMGMRINIEPMTIHSLGYTSAEQGIRESEKTLLY